VSVGAVAVFPLLDIDHSYLTCFHSFRSVGIHQRPGDLAVNVCKTKQLTNMRSATKGITVGITAPIDMSLDACVEYIASDEILECTPTKFRMAKNPDMMGKNGKKKN
jgi:GTP-binding protein